MAGGTKAMFEAPKLDSTAERTAGLEQSLQSGEWRTIRDRSFFPQDEGALLYNPQQKRYGYVPHPHDRGDGEAVVIAIPGLDSEVQDDHDRMVGAEFEKIVVYKQDNPMGRAGDLAPVRDFDSQLAKEIPRYEAASTTTELYKALDESDIAPTPERDLRQVLGQHIASRVLGFDREGVQITPFATTAQELSDDILDEHPYIESIIGSHPEYQKYFDGTGTQFHRAIRRNEESPREAVEMAAFTANRLQLYSWYLQLLGGSSPNLKGIDDIASYYGQSQNMNQSDVHELERLTVDRQPVGHSLRTLGRYAGSAGGAGVPRQPIPESFTARLNEMDDVLRRGVANSADRRENGQHADTRIRHSIGATTHHGTYETSVPDTTLQIDRSLSLHHVHDALIEKAHTLYKTGDGELPLSDRFMEDPSQVSDYDLLLSRHNSLAVALYGAEARLKLADGGRLNATVAARQIAQSLDLPQFVRDEVQIATTPFLLSSAQRDHRGLPTYDNYFIGDQNGVRAPSLPSIYEQRMKGQEYSGQDFATTTRQEVSLAAHSLVRYATRLSQKPGYTSK